MMEIGDKVKLAVKIQDKQSECTLLLVKMFNRIIHYYPHIVGECILEEEIDKMLETWGEVHALALKLGVQE